MNPQIPDNVYRDIALKALDLGLSPGIPKEDGTKAPDGRWKRLQTTPATREEVIGWYRRGRTGNALFTGYGNVECFEFDDRAIYGRFLEAAVKFGLGDLVERIRSGYEEESPGGGVHWLTRCEAIAGNTKLAERPAPTEDDPHKREPLIETRGVGGFIIIAPSNGKVHPSGGAYRLLHGSLETIATITPDEREALWQLARTFDEVPVEPEPATNDHSEPGRYRDGIRPGADFNARARLADIIEPQGWTREHVSEGVEYWKRPGKNEPGWSATWGKTKGFRVFTTATSLAARSYSLFGLYCHLKHNGDWKACVKDLVEQGYGTWIDEDGKSHQNPRPKDNAAPAGDATKPEKKPRKPRVHAYQERDGCLWHGDERLANFTARITHTITRYEGNSEVVRYRIVARHSRGCERPSIIEAEKYSSMSWVYSLGAEFAIEPGREVKDLLRHGIQMLSDQHGIGQAIEHTSIGWIKHANKWIYLHASGAIGVDGASGGIDVDVSSTLGRYRLPTSVPGQEALRKAMRAHLDIRTAAKDGRPGGRGVAVLVATLPWRAVLGAFDASVHLGGPSGNMKTSAARLVYQHFADVKGRNSPMPADWRSTISALQRLAFDCRDSVLIVDDLKFEEQVKTAEVLMQSQGNLQSRLRMNVDQTMHQALDPRGSILSTGEIDPRTRSTLGRILMNEIRAGDIDLEALSKLQAAGDEGLFSLLMTAYIGWLAPQLDEVQDEHRRLTREIQKEIGDIPGAHPRHADIIAQLIAAYRLFMQFAVNAKLTEQITADAQLDQARRLLVELGRAQVEFQDEASPGRQFLDLLISALQSGRCHLCSTRFDPAPAEYPSACGWRWEVGAKDGGQWRVPGGSKCIGFIDESEGLVYLDPTESQSIASEMARAQHNPQSFTSVGRELLQESLVKAHSEGDKTRASQAVRIHGVLKRCFWVQTKHLFNPE